MGNIKQINTKNLTYYFFHDMANVKLTKNTQKILQKHWYLLHSIHHNKK